MSRKYKQYVTEHDIADVVIQAACEVHRTLGGPGFLACIYEQALLFELEVRGKRTEPRMTVPLVYKGRRLTTELPVVVVEKKVLVDCRATPEWAPLYEVEAAKHLRLLDLPLAVVINFGLPHVLDGIRPVSSFTWRSTRRGA